MTTYVNTVNQTEIFVEGRGDMGRTPFYSKTDLLVSHELPMAGNKRLRFELNVLNLFNQKTARHIFNYLNRGAGAPRASSAIDLARRRPVQRATTTTRMIRATLGRRERARSALRHGRPVRSRHAGTGSVKFLF